MARSRLRQATEAGHASTLPTTQLDRLPQQPLQGNSHKGTTLFSNLGYDDIACGSSHQNIVPTVLVCGVTV